jgi:hypothetical protein
MQQRVRVASVTVARALASAGVAPSVGADTDLLTASTAAIAPYNTGTDPPGTFKSDTITILSTSKTGAPLTTTYWLKTDAAMSTYQLMMSDGSNLDVPVVDHVVGLAFEYFGDPQPPLMRRPLTDPSGPWTTYGARPAATAGGAFGPGENCLFLNDGSPVPAPRLDTLGPPGSALVPLTAARLTDGPWCPDQFSSSRWDADLLRVRRIAVTIRIEAATAALRGPAGALFAHGGTSRGGIRWVPDAIARFEIAPRNLAVGR